MALTQEQFDLLKQQLQKAKQTLPPDQYLKMTDAISQNIEQESFGKKLYKGIASPILNLLARPGQLYEELRGREAPYGKIAGVDITPPPQTFEDVKKDIGRGIKTAAMAIPAGSIIGLGIAGGAFGLGEALEEGHPLFSKDTVLQTLLGAGTGVAIGAGTKLVGTAISKTAETLKKPVAKIISNITGWTSDTAPDVIEKAILEPSVFGQAQKTLKETGNRGILENLQNGIRKLRADLTDYYKIGERKIIDASQNVRVGLNEKELSLFTKIADKFGVDLPQNPLEFSSKELLDLNKEINSLYSKKMVREGAEGIIVRKGKDVLDKIIENNFKETGIDEFLKGYGIQKKLFDGLNSLFYAFRSGEPKAASQAYRDMLNVFQQDKFAWAEAVDELGKKMNVNLLDQLRAIQLQPLIRKSGKFSMDEIFRLILAPLTSPKLVGVEAKLLGRSLNAAATFGEFISKLPNLVEKAQKIKILP